ncbi:MAG TPA: hypothetical protein PKD87_05620, partial [Burkholderiaceae bacterium]|nr:hypothetical protein [Burkholderiaceae bacterium]
MFIGRPLLCRPRTRIVSNNSKILPQPFDIASFHELIEDRHPSEKHRIAAPAPARLGGPMTLHNIHYAH